MRTRLCRAFPVQNISYEIFLCLCQPHWPASNEGVVVGTLDCHVKPIGGWHARTSPTSSLDYISYSARFPNHNTSHTSPSRLPNPRVTLPRAAPRMESLHIACSRVLSPHHGGVEGGGGADESESAGLGEHRFRDVMGLSTDLQTESFIPDTPANVGSQKMIDSTAGSFTKPENDARQGLRSRSHRLRRRLQRPHGEWTIARL
jgi:hypothetical protein